MGMSRAGLRLAPGVIAVLEQQGYGALMPMQVRWRGGVSGCGVLACSLGWSCCLDSLVWMATVPGGRSSVDCWEQGCVHRDAGIRAAAGGAPAHGQEPGWCAPACGGCALEVTLPNPQFTADALA